MEPISMVVGALVAGASSALKDTASQAVKDSYQGLKVLVIRQWNSMHQDNEKAKETEAKKFFDSLEDNPEQFKAPLEEKLSQIMPEPNITLIEQARQLYKLLGETRDDPRTFGATISNSQGVQVGDQNYQSNTFK